MDATQNRLNNFAELFRQFREAHLHLPDRGMLKLFAQKVEVSEKYLSHVKCGRRSLGSATARQIEARCGKPQGWMDAQHSEMEPQNSDERDVVEQILLLYRRSPETVKKLIVQAVKEVLKEKSAS
jgi:hypothetical protein